MQPEESLEKSGYGIEICKREVAEKREEERRTGVIQRQQTVHKSESGLQHRPWRRVRIKYKTRSTKILTTGYSLAVVEIN